MDITFNIRAKQENKSIRDESRVSKHRAGGDQKDARQTRRSKYRTIS